MKKFLTVFNTEEEYLEYTASTDFHLNSVSRCREGNLVFFNPESCGGQGMHRTISGETYCDGYDKRVYLYKQVSYDDGVTWETTATTSSLIEKDSEDCGYVPPTPSNWYITAKFNVTDTSNPTRIASGTSSFTKIEIDGVEQPSVITGYTFNTTGEHIIKYTLKDTSIGNSAFSNCTSLTSIDIPSGVTSIGYSAFYKCNSFTSVTVNASVPPTLGNIVFDDTNNCPIYVPCDSVDTYKAETNWSTYASRIQAIQGSCPKINISNAVVTSDDAVYNGNIQTAQNITVTLSGTTLTENTDYTVTSNTSGTNAGSYAITVSGMGNYEGTASGTFTINKVTPTVVAPTAKELTYNGSAQALVNAGSTNYGTLKYSLDNVTYITSIPSGTNIGDYTVYYKVDGDSNVNNVAANSITVSIAGEMPYDSEVEYLYGNENQYIDTGIIPDATYGIKVIFKNGYKSSELADKYIVGLRNNSSGTRWAVGVKDNEMSTSIPIYYAYGGYNYIYPSQNYTASNTISTAYLNYLNDNNFRCEAENGINGSTTLPSLGFTPSYNIRLFGSAGVSASYSRWKGYIYGVTITRGSEIVMDLIPVRKNGVGYMYDKISGTLYGNNGSGSFTIGNDK